jgi:hypothetical protein
MKVNLPRAGSFKMKNAITVNPNKIPAMILNVSLQPHIEINNVVSFIIAPPKELATPNIANAIVWRAGGK